MNVKELEEKLNEQYKDVEEVDSVKIDYVYENSKGKSTFYIKSVDNIGSQHKIAMIKGDSVSFGTKFNRPDVAEVIFNFTNQDKEKQFDVERTLTLNNEEMDFIKKLVKERYANTDYNIKDPNVYKARRLCSHITHKINESRDQISEDLIKKTIEKNQDSIHSLFAKHFLRNNSLDDNQSKLPDLGLASQLFNLSHKDQHKNDKSDLADPNRTV